MPETVSFHRMDEGTEEDYALLHKQEQNFIAGLPSRIVKALENLEHSLSGYQVSRLEHSLQTATRAEQVGADKELIVAALIHDIGDDLAPENHSQMAAAIIRPYVRAEVTWILEMHGVFQMYYYADKIGLNKMSGITGGTISGLMLVRNFAAIVISYPLTRPFLANHWNISFL